MKIAYLLGPTCLFSTAGHGVKMQAKVWGEELSKRGHEVTYISEWDSVPVKDFDIVHLFGTGLWLLDVVKRLSKKNPNILLSPIIDSKNDPTLYKFATYLAIPRLNIYSSQYALRAAEPYLKRIYVRSEHEGRYMAQSYGVKAQKIVKVPLSGRFQVENNTIEKEPFCLSVSSICNGRKNVVRLIEAANKYGFNLVLAGNPGTEQEFAPLKRAIGNNKNIKVLGFVDNDTLKNLYQRAKVFALPSIIEGVGLTALEAAHYGCDIVITNIGGPKEYYGEFAYQADPYSLDDIGQQVINALNTTKQPALNQYLEQTSSMKVTIDILERSYIELL